MIESEGYIFGEYIPIFAGKTNVAEPFSTWLPRDPDPRDAYYAKRKRCPVCDGTWVSQTLVGYTLDLARPQDYKDENRATCQACGWVGIVHDMKPL